MTEIPSGVKFLSSSCSGCLATIFVQPMDLVKNRMQMSGEAGGARQHKSTVHAIRNIFRAEGIFGFYNGVGAGLLRQITYTGTRLGIYTTLFQKFSSSDGKPPSFLKKTGIAMTAGGIGAMVGTPAELCLIRMTSDGRLPIEQRRNYKNVFDALYRVTKEEGVFTLWRGCGPTVGRAIVVNISQLVSYSQAKEVLQQQFNFGSGLSTHFVASMISALITTFASLPVDIAKTRLQNMKVVDGIKEYKGFVDVWSKIIRSEGFFALWKGFTPYYSRLGPHTVLTFIFLEQILGWYKSTKGIKSSASL